MLHMNLSLTVPRETYERFKKDSVHELNMAIRELFSRVDAGDYERGYTTLNLDGESAVLKFHFPSKQHHDTDA